MGHDAQLTGPRVLVHASATNGTSGVKTQSPPAAAHVEAFALVPVAAQAAMLFAMQTSTTSLTAFWYSQLPEGETPEQDEKLPAAEHAAALAATHDSATAAV